MQANLLNIAKAFDQGDGVAATALLRATDHEKLTGPSRIVVLGLWRRAYALGLGARPLSPDELRRVDRFFDRLTVALRRQDVWPLLAEFEACEALFGARDLSLIVRSVLWDLVPTTPFGFQYQALTRVFLGESGIPFQQFFAHLLSKDRSFVPDYWQTQCLIRSWSETGVSDPVDAMSKLLTRTDRDDLVCLCEIYVLLATQKDADRGYALAKTLQDPVHKERLSSYLLGVSQTEATIARAVELHAQLCEDPAQRQFMQARLATALQQWDRVCSLTESLIWHHSLRHEAICLRALALSHLGDFANARAAISHVRHNHGAKWFLRARANLINVSRRLLEDGQSKPNDQPAPALALGGGRPLAQSLWIGPRLRWIEELSIRSYLANGWRYQLYTYETPENLPDGVELMDAAAILPRTDFFAEGANSGMHKGSVGAFSDLFRYAMISQRGGMWTDTDVINLKPFDPEGARFISTERSDAGLIGLNGALMAAPAGDTLQMNALRRAQELVAQGGMHFARIGPELLAEIIGDGGSQGYHLLPTDFHNPIGWMETGMLLRPYDEVAARIARIAPMNIHVYTETWRLLGLSLDRPPQGDGYLSTLYDRLMNVSLREMQQGTDWLRLAS